MRDWILWMWTGLALFWLVTALRSKPAVRRQSAVGRAIELALMLVAVVLLFYEWPRVPWLNQRIVPRTFEGELAGVALTMMGTLAAIVARAYLGTNWSGRPSIKEGHTLICRGPYGVVRHPIYTGLLTAAFGTAIAFGEVRSLLALPLMLGVVWLKIRVEEQLLMEAMGEEYAAYRQAVRSAMIPFIL